MSTWMVHFYIADYFMDKIPGIDKSEFSAGSLAPDCGYGEKDSNGQFSPPPQITHWSLDGNKSNCRCEDFFNTYLSKKDTYGYSFYLGYYVHLLTDVMWSKAIYGDFLKKIDDGICDNSFFELKRECNLLDFKYFKENKQPKSFQLISELTDINDYLPYYEKGQLLKQLKFIIDFYNNENNLGLIGKSEKYINKTIVNDFINQAQDNIKFILQSKNKF